VGRFAELASAGLRLRIKNLADIFGTAARRPLSNTAIFFTQKGCFSGRSNGSARAFVRAESTMTRPFLLPLSGK
jgi:hypothetical protein